MPVLVIYFVIWVLLGLLVGALAGLITGSEPPYGLAADLAAGVLTMINVGLLDHIVLEAMEYTGIIGLVVKIIEPLTSAAVVLWLLRVVKRRSEASV